MVRNSSKIGRLLRARRLKIFFRVHGVADLYAANGLVTALGISKRDVVIEKVGHEISSGKIRECLPGFSIAKKIRLTRDLLPITFDTEGPMRLGSDDNPIFTYDPFKYFLFKRSFHRKQRRLKSSLGLLKGRKIISVSCTGADEARCVIEAFKKLEAKPRPLLVLALRKPEGFRIRIPGIRTHRRKSAGEFLPKLGAFDMAVLGTMGEFLDWVAVSDLAVIGHDRNIFEPAFCGVPVLYFKRPLKMNPQEESLAASFNLFWRKNRTALWLLNHCGAAKPIRPGSLDLQMNEILRNPASMIRGSRRAVRRLYIEVLPKARAKAASILARSLDLKKPFESL